MQSHLGESKILAAIVLGLFSFMILAEAIPSTESLFSRLMTQGKEYYENGELDLAAAKYKSAQAVAANNDEMADAYFLLALTYYALVDMENCRSSLENYFSISVTGADPLLDKTFPARFTDFFKSQKKEYLLKVAGTVTTSAQMKKTDPQPTVREQETKAPKVKKKKKFPWLLVIAITLVAGAAVYYFAVINKKYTLTTNVGTGVNGTPETSNAKYKKGTVVSYSYSIKSGYINLIVTLDGSPIAASGTITMDKNHILKAEASESYILTVTKKMGVEGVPATGMYTYARGSIANYNYTAASGFTDLVVKLDGVAVAASGTVPMNANHTLTAEVANMFALTVVRYAGVDGSPVTGTYTYKKGTEVNFDYSLTGDYTDLRVWLDGINTNHSGKVTMNADHTLLSWSWAELYLDISAVNQASYENPIFQMPSKELLIGPSSNILAGLVFPNVRIPKGAPIVNSYVLYRGIKSGSGSNPTIRFTGFSEDNASVFSADGSNKPSTRPGTVKYVEDSDGWAGSYYDPDWTWSHHFPDVSEIIDEIITRPGWKSGNSIGFKITNPTGAGYGVLIQNNYDFPGDRYTPVLRIIYSTRIVSD